MNWAKVVGWLLSPLALALACLGSALLLDWLRRPLAGLLVGLLGFAGLWWVSTPLVAHALAHQLEALYPALLVEHSPKADAIVVLGGALSGASPPERPLFDLGSAADRVWFAAALYQAGKAPKIAVAFKENLRLWFRDLLSRLGVADAEGLATQLAVLVDGSIAQDLVRNDPSMARAAREAARVLLKNAGVKVSDCRPSPRTAKTASQTSIRTSVFRPAACRRPGRNEHGRLEGDRRPL